ncbi:hypothetical protein CAP35_01245 [Chitinophagaceae bacterium IBVUCB1]|nr:hypothetical protein CAP35_01245 [Chitinophagaceae bacterium IBVUCB1]
MKEQSKNGWLLPLGIGAGVLLLIAGVKKKANATPVMPGADAAGSVALETQVPKASGQINPSPAPSYTRSSLPQPENAGSGTDARQQITEDEADTLPANSEQASYDTDQGMEEQDAYRESSNEEEDETGDHTAYTKAAPMYANGKQQSYHPGNASGASAGSMSVAHRPGAYNPKQMRFDNTVRSGNKHSIKAYADPSAKQSAYKPMLKTTQKPSMRHQTSISRKPSMRVLQPVAASNMRAVNPAATRMVSVFPLRMGSRNTYVKELQRRIGVSATGYFGTATSATIRNKYGVSEVSEALYTQIIRGKAVARKPPAKTIVRQKPVQQKHIVARHPAPAQKNTGR